MNYNTINKYVTLLRQAEYAEDGPIIDALYEQMDTAWYEMNDDDREYLRKLRGHVTADTNILEFYDSILTTIEDITMKTNNLFQSKEEYQTFIDFWKRIHRDGTIKPVRHEYIGSRFDPSTKDILYFPGHYNESPLTAHRHVVYLAITGRSFSKAFGKIHLSTLNHLRDNARVALTFKNPKYRTEYFEFFGDSINEEIKDKVLHRIIEELDKLEANLHA